MDLASRLIEAGQSKEARPIIAELRALPWSETFHPDIPEALREMAAAAAVDLVLPPPRADAPPVGTETSSPAKKTPPFDHMEMGLKESRN